MARSDCRCGTDPNSTGDGDGTGEAAEGKQPAEIQRTQGAVRYLYMAGALAAVVLLIMLAAV